MSDADVSLRLTGKADPSVAAAFDASKQEVADLAAATRAAAKQEAADLALVKAQYGQLGEAINASAVEGKAAEEAVAAFGVSATQGLEAATNGAEAADKALAALDAKLVSLGEGGVDTSAAVGRLRVLQDEFEKTFESASAVTRAEKAVDQFFKSAATGSRGAVRDLAKAEKALKDLEEETRRLRSSGKDVAAYEDRIVALRKKIADGTVQVGKFAAANRDAADAAKAASRGAGEFEGTLTSLEDIVNAINPELGNTVVKLLAVQAAFSIVTGTAKEIGDALHDTALALGASERTAKELANAFELNPLKRFSEQLRQGREDIREYFADLEDGFERRALSAFVGFGREAARAGKEFAESIEGQKGAVLQRTEAILAGVQAIRKDGIVTRETAAAVVAAIDEQEAALRRLGKASPELARVRQEMERLASNKTAADLEYTAQRIAELADRFSAIGIGSEGAIGTAVSQLQRFIKETEAAGGATSQQAAVIVTQARAIAEAIKAIPGLAEKAGVNKILFDLDLAAHAYARLAIDAKTAFGVIGAATVEELTRSVDIVNKFVAEVEVAGKATPAQALLIIHAIDGIRENVATLPDSQRQATAKVVASLEVMEAKYRSAGEVALLAFGVQTPDALRRSAESVVALAAAFGPLGTVTKEEAEKVAGEAGKILGEIGLLPPAQRAAVKDIEGSLVDLVVKYGTAAAKQKDYALDVQQYEAGLIEKRKAAAASLAATLASGLSALIQQLREAEAATKGLGEGGDTSVLKKELADLQELQDKGPITQEQQARINELTDALLEAGDGAARFASGLDGAAASGGRVVATSQQVDGVLRTVLGTINDNAEGWRGLSLATRQAIEVQIGQLQAAGNQGFATADVLTSSLGSVRDALQGAGFDVSGLNAALGGLQDGTVDLNRSFGLLDNSVSKGEQAYRDFAAKAVEGTAKTKVGTDEMKKSTDAAKDAVHELGTTTAEAAKIMTKSVVDVNAGLGEMETRLRRIGPLIEKVLAGEAVTL